ncbi:MAG: hypothetical protein RIT14_513 [Pseudomonadota bacterium]
MRLRLRPDARPQGIVPASGHTAWLLFFTAAAMSFLAVFALALALTSGQIAARWSDALARTATVRISAAAEASQAQQDAVLDILRTTPGIATARALTDEDQRALLAPWFGPDLPLDDLPMPRLIEVTETAEGFDAEGLRLRLSAEVPGAVLDDHGRWRRPLATAAARLNLLGSLSVLLILAVMAAMVTLAASAALSANAQMIRVLRLVGATDAYIAAAFVRRFTLHSLSGAIAGTLAGMNVIALLPPVDAAGTFLSGLGFQGSSWLLPLLLPPAAAGAAFVATRTAAFRKLRELP